MATLININFFKMAVGDEDLFTWNVEMEVGLFHAMRGHKPVGVNKNFQMMCIHEKFHQVTGRKISSKHIWKHLSTMYDMQALDESEILPFPNTQTDFTLPSSDFGELISTKRKDPDKPLATRSSSVSSDEGSASKTDSIKATFRMSGGPASFIATMTPSEKDNSPKRKRTRQAIGTTPSPGGNSESSAKRRR